METTIVSKQCVKCGLEKPLEDYHNRKVGRLGKHSWCKPCMNAYRSLVYAAREKGDPEYYQRKNSQKQASNERHPDRHKARLLANRFKNVLKKSNCEECGGTDGLHMHHPDYTRPLDVKTLCRGCHDRLHYAQS